MSEGNPEFKRWLALYFIQKGYYKITDKAVEEFGTDELPRQFMEFAEMYCNREREERLEYRKEHTRIDMKNTAMARISVLIDSGKAGELYDNEYIVKSLLSWKDKNVRVAVIRKLVEIIKINPTDLKQKDFRKNKIEGMLNVYYNGSPYKAVNDAFPEKKIKPWEMLFTPDGFFDKKENRIAAVKWLVKKLKKDPRDLTVADFYDNRLGGLLDIHYNDSPYKAVKEAFSGMDIKPWEMAVTQRGFFDDKKNRMAAVKWLVEKLKKDLRDLTVADFYDNRLTGLLKHCYNNSPYEAVKEAFPELDIKFWKMVKSPRFYDKKENRVAAVKWLVEKLKKEARDITVKDFNRNSLRGVLPYYGDSPYEALKEAGLVSEGDENYIRRRHGVGFLTPPSSKQAREAARKLARKAGKKQPVKGRDKKVKV